MTTYDSLHRQCRTLESLFDAKLTSYSRLASTVSKSPDDLESHGSRERWKDLESEVDDLLEKLEETNEQLALLANNPDSEISQSMNRAIQRHRDVYHDYARELKRTKANVQQAIDQSNLLSGVRNDIDAYKSSAAESLLAERSRIDGSHAIADEMLEQAFETRSEFSRQRHSLTAINTRMTSVISTIPGVNKLVSMISSRRRRDTIILGVVIGVCILIILTYAWR